MIYLRKININPLQTVISLFKLKVETKYQTSVVFILRFIFLIIYIYITIYYSETTLVEPIQVLKHLCK